MTSASEFEAFAHLVGKLAPDARLLRAWPLRGGYSAHVTALEIAHTNGQRERLVVRQHGTADRARDPDIAANEYALLAALRAARLPVPTPRLVDETRDIFPAPVLVTHFVDGVSEFAPVDMNAHVSQLASLLVQIHQIDTAILPPTLPQLRPMIDARVQTLPQTPTDAAVNAWVQKALRALWPWPQVNAPTLLHGDFWPGNLLWRDGTLAAILDWEDATLGDPLADLGNARLEVLWAFGPRAMRQLTAAYQSQRPTLDYANLPYWDLFAADARATAMSTWGMGADVERRMHVRLRSFVANALIALP